jgi:hypothetical protein
MFVGLIQFMFLATIAAFPAAWGALCGLLAVVGMAVDKMRGRKAHA